MTEVSKRSVCIKKGIVFFVELVLLFCADDGARAQNGAFPHDEGTTGRETPNARLRPATGTKNALCLLQCVL